MIEDIIRAVLGLSPGTKKINADLASMRLHLRSQVEQLIPWKEEKELELMSLNIQFDAKKKGLDKIVFGTIQSIYFEPMVAFAYKDYVKGEHNALLYCRTSGMEYVYRIKKQSTDVYFNGELVASMDHSSTLYGLRSRNVIGAVRPYSGDLLSILIWGKDVGHMFNPLRPHSMQQRAFSILAGMNDEQENIFLALGLYELLSRALTKKNKK
jgi:hypothetical protein